MSLQTSLGVPILGLDEAWDKVPADQLVAHGYKWVAGYLSPDVNGKNWTPDLIAQYHNAGIATVAVWEYAADAAKHGGNQGKLDASRACTLLRSLGWPKGRTVYFAIDFDASPADLLTIRDYLAGAITVCEQNGYHADAYAEFMVIDDLRRAGLIAFGWQTYAWSHGQWADGVVLRQVKNGVIVAGHNVDNDAAYSLEFGQWAPPGWNPGPGIGGIMQPDQARQLADVDYATTQDFDMDKDGQRVPLQVFTYQMGKHIHTIESAINALTAKVDTLTQTVTTLAQADQVVAQTLAQLATKLGELDSAQNVVVGAWVRIADAADRLAPPAAPVTAPAVAPAASPATDSLS